LSSEGDAVRGCTVELACEASGRGPPLLLLHGLLASSANWCGIAEALASSHRVYRVDLRNHGASPWALDMSYPAMADDVLRLIEREGLDAPTLVGHSMGGKVAMALALAVPYAVKRLVTIDVAPVTYIDRFSHQVQAMIDTLARDPLSARDPAAACPADAALAQLLMPRLSARHSYVDWRCNLGVIARSMQGLCAFPRTLRHLRSNVPLTAIAGERSDCVLPAGPALYQPMFARTTVRVVQGAGHWVHADRPEALLAELRRALGVRTRQAAARAA
jgi:pimeloyl-ACP methyl ester carboxylesterase